MKKYVLVFSAFLFYNCTNHIKDENATVLIEEGTQLDLENDTTANNEHVGSDKFIGYWVGDFKRTGDEFDDRDLYVDEGFYWNRSNKINLSIDSMTNTKIYGHSVVAGNQRPFTGEVNRTAQTLKVEAKEPGDDKYDGEFNFSIENDTLKGTWRAFKKIEIPKRIYTLVKKRFKYNPNIMLEKQRLYVDWRKEKKIYETYTVNDSTTIDWIESEFATSTDKIYAFNASSKLLSKAEVENLKRGDLIIIRNTIYARHGYSFKSRPLRVFFDAQDWYIPITNDIKADFTEIEKANIQLLLNYEKNAAEHYDYFGRG